MVLRAGHRASKARLDNTGNPIEALCSEVSTDTCSDVRPIGIETHDHLGDHVSGEAGHHAVSQEHTYFGDDARPYISVENARGSADHSRDRPENFRGEIPG
jgi:hypothetical protein